MPVMRETLHVVAAYIERDGAVLLDQRRKGSHLEDRWEFPGGKRQPGETDVQALLREIREELGVDSAVTGPAIATVRHAYDAFDVVLTLYPLRIDGTPRAVDVAAIEWFPRAGLRALPMPPADVPLIDAIFALYGPDAS